MVCQEAELTNQRHNHCCMFLCVSCGCLLMALLRLQGVFLGGGLTFTLFALSRFFFLFFS